MNNLSTKINQIKIPPSETEINAGVKEKINFLYKLDVLKVKEIYNRVTNFSRGLEQKYPNAREYYLFHTIIGSSMDREHCKAGFDFPGEDSIVKYVDELYEEYRDSIYYATV
ncbi:MAG: hypothetical protein WC349_04065 [Patescibacteria group bacterium]|jgi:hypothetical protein